MTKLVLDGWKPAGGSPAPSFMMPAPVEKELFPKALELLRGKEPSNALINAIEQSNNRVAIYAVGDTVSNTCFIDKSESNKACYCEVLKDETLRPAIATALNGNALSEGVKERLRGRLAKLTGAVCTFKENAWVVPAFETTPLNRGKLGYLIRDRGSTPKSRTV